MSTAFMAHYILHGYYSAFSSNHLISSGFFMWWMTTSWKSSEEVTGGEMKHRLSKAGPMEMRPPPQQTSVGVLTMNSGKILRSYGEKDHLWYHLYRVTEPVVHSIIKPQLCLPPLSQAPRLDSFLNAFVYSLHLTEKKKSKESAVLK